MGEKRFPVKRAQKKEFTFPYGGGKHFRGIVDGRGRSQSRKKKGSPGQKIGPVGGGNGISGTSLPEGRRLLQRKKVLKKEKGGETKQQKHLEG